MRKFNYLKLMDLSPPVNVYHMIASIHEYKGKQELYVENYPDVLEKMIDVAKIQSTKSSNAIEGIYTNDARLKELMKKKAEPKNRNEEEIAGYRHVLDIIHENYAYIEFNKNDILTLHNQLYSYSYINNKGKFKTMDNTIVEVDALGNKKVLAKADIQDTPEMNQKIAEKILEDAKKVTAENTSIESRFKGTKKDVIIESKWIPNIEGPYCTTIIIKEVK
mgnify:CR=1 FL=1